MKRVLLIVFLIAPAVLAQTGLPNSKSKTLVFAADGGVIIPVSATSVATSVTTANGPGACASVATTSSTILTAFSARRFAEVCARVSNSAVVRIKLGATATTSNFPLEAGQCYRVEAVGGFIYTGQIDAISEAGTQSVCITEI